MSNYDAWKTTNPDLEDSRRWERYVEETLTEDNLQQMAMEATVSAVDSLELAVGAGSFGRLKVLIRDWLEREVPEADLVDAVVTFLGVKSYDQYGESEPDPDTAWEARKEGYGY